MPTVPGARPNSTEMPPVASQFMQQAEALTIQMRQPQPEPSKIEPGIFAAPIDPSQYETKLSPEDETKFRDWKSKYAPKDSGYDYDLRGAFKEGFTPDPETGHWKDKYKKPNHPTFSNESMYAKDRPDLAGSWDGDTFIPPKGR